MPPAPLAPSTNPPPPPSSDDNPSIPMQSHPVPITAAYPRPMVASLQSSYSPADFRKDFFFRRRHGQLNWTKLRDVDLEKVVRTVDVDALQDNVEHITFADISETDLAQLTDANFLQLFRLTQLIIEYLLNVQNFLLASSKKKEATYEQVLAELEATRTALAERTESDRASKKELKYCRRVIKAYEKNLGNKWEELNQAATIGTATTAPSKCVICGSVFVNYDYLVGHYSRRHPNEKVPDRPAPPVVQIVAASSPTTQSQDLATWKKEMEAAVRAQLADSQRNTARNRQQDEEKENSEVMARLGKMESTLAAVLNSNTLPVKAAEPSAATVAAASRAGGLRDDDGGSRVTEDSLELKEYLRRQLFDLHEEIRTLKEERKEHAYMAPYPTVHEPLQMVGQDLSPHGEQHATQLLQRFRSSPLPHPHPPSYPHTTPLPHGTEVIPRHVPQTHLQPVPPPTASPVRPPPPPIPPTAMQRLREILLAHQDKRFELFPDLPGLRSKFLHPEEELISHLNSFGVIANTLVEHGRTGEVDAEMNSSGYAPLFPDIESEVDDYVRTNYKRSPELIEAFRLVTERGMKNEALGKDYEAAREQERQKRDAWHAEIAKLSALRESIDLSRSQDLARRRAEHDRALAAAQEEDRLAAERLRQFHEQQMREVQQAAEQAKVQALNVRIPTTTTATTTNPNPTPSLQSGQTPIPASSPAVLSSSATTPAASPSSNMYPNSPLNYPEPSISQTPVPVPEPTVGLQPPQPSLPPQLPPSSFSNNPAILNPSLALTKQPTLAKQPTSILKKTNTVIALRPNELDADDEFEDEDDEKSSFTRGVSRPNSQTVAAGGSFQQRPTAQSTAATTTNVTNPPIKTTLPSPQAVPVPIPARPNKSVVAAAIKPTTPVVNVNNDVDAVQPFSGGDSPSHHDSEKPSLTTRPNSFAQPDTKYEHSTARQHDEGDPEFGGLEHVYEQREAELREQQVGSGIVGGEDDVHHFSPPVMSAASTPIQPKPTSGRILPDDESELPLLTGRFGGSRTNSLIPPTHTSSTLGGDIRQPSAAATSTSVATHHPSRFLQPVTQSANFSVASSGDWKSDADILDDDVEELIA